jgi:hypothetical protein
MPVVELTSVLENETQSPPCVESTAPTVSRGSRWSSVLWLVLIALAVRLAFLFVLHTYRFDRIDDFCSVGETTDIAASIAKGRGFSSPFGNDYTGPTAWIAPIYPYFLAFVFRCFGIMTHASSIVIFAVQSAFSALTVIPILGIARPTVGKQAGVWAAWTWALFPWFSKWSVSWLWEISLSTLLFALLFWYALSLAENSSVRRWIGFGALWGFALLVNPALAVLLPISIAWCGYSLHGRKQEWMKPALAAIVTCIIAISPWLVRNRVVFGQWVFLRDNFGFEFALGNYHASFGRGWGGRHPMGNPREYARYKQMGEIAYVAAAQKQALKFVHDSPGEFVSLTANRLAYFWDGSAMHYRPPVAWYWVPSSFPVISFLLLPGLLVSHRQKVFGWWMFFGAVLSYPMPYYLTFSQVRYRHVIEPLILLLAAFAAVQLRVWIPKRWKARLSPAAPGN